ncbi:MAG: YceH family protein [Planctomycetes bacterium]|nr:YceH family protein [Planctomycetota bacterium]
MPITLNAVQRRVLGVLIEKSRTTPAAYPLTLNAVVLGCNQLSCREPVMRLNEDDVAKALRELGEMELAAEVDPDRGARVERYKHLAEEKCGWNEAQLAVLAELLLRGPQTAGELKTNASRMAAVPDLESIMKLLEAFAAQEPPVVRHLPRAPGKSAPRYDHLFYPADEPQDPPGVAPSPPVPPAALEARVAKLESDVAALREEISGLRHLWTAEGQR